MNYHYTVYRSPYGPIHLLAGSKGLRVVGLLQSSSDFHKEYSRYVPGEWIKTNPEDHTILQQAFSVLDAYFKKGQPLPNSFPLELSGTSFQIKVWITLRKIKFGKTSTYGQIAEKIGKPKAARAVGGACGSNPLPLFIPCHRVLAGNGGLGGFGGGLDLKRDLLKLETQNR